MADGKARSDGRFTPETGRKAGRRGGRARRKLNLERVETELGPLETIEDAMRRLDRLNIWIACGLLNGSAGGAAVRSIEVWLRGNESKLTQQVVDELQGELTRVKGEIKGRPPLKVTG